jgi:hypothetical protein
MGHVVCMEDIRNAYKSLVEKPHRKKPLMKDVGVDGRIVSRWILWKCCCRLCIGVVWLRVRGASWPLAYTVINLRIP